MLYYFKIITIPGLLSLVSQSTEGYQVHIRYKLYPVTFGNDHKSYQNKSHNEITV